MCCARTKRRKIRAYVDNIISNVNEDDKTQTIDAYVTTENSPDERGDNLCVELSDEELSTTVVPENENTQTHMNRSSLDNGAELESYDHEENHYDPSCDISDEFSDSDASDSCGDIRVKLASWAVKFGISHSALSDLLVILKSCDLNVPRDPRSSASDTKSIRYKNSRLFFLSLWCVSWHHLKAF